MHSGEQASFWAFITAPSREERLDRSTHSQCSGAFAVIPCGFVLIPPGRGTEMHGSLRVLHLLLLEAPPGAWETPGPPLLRLALYLCSRTRGTPVLCA